MDWLRRNIKWLMLGSGLLTCTMLYAAIAPEAALRASFGDSLSGPLAEIVVRNWGALIFLVGAMLVYGAFHPPVRRMAVTVATVSKLVFVSLVLGLGQQFMAKAQLAVVIDSIWIVVFATWLLASRGKEA